MRTVIRLTASVKQTVFPKKAKPAPKRQFSSILAHPTGDSSG